MITVIAEHSVDLSLLPEKANVLDLGCRGFLFSDEMQRLGHNVVCIDADDTLTGRTYGICAITNKDGLAEIHVGNDPQGLRVTQIENYSNKKRIVKTLTLSSLSNKVGIKFWDLIKIDIEGAEYEVIMSLTEPPAKQLSIEFHLHTGIYGLTQMAEMHDKLRALGYEAVSHEMSKQHGCGLNFWDSLFVLK
jgi:hypothetical protein